MTWAQRMRWISLLCLIVVGTSLACSSPVDDLKKRPASRQASAAVQVLEELARGECTANVPAWPDRFDYWNEAMQGPNPACWARAALAAQR